MKVYFMLTTMALIFLGACSEDDSDKETTDSEFTLSSSAVADGELLDEYQCEEKTDGMEESIPLSWSDVPEDTTSLAIAMTHYPDPEDLTNISSYLLLWDIPPDVTALEYGAADDDTWFMGSNKDGNAISNTSPCSQGEGTHEYTITIYALSETPPTSPSESTLEVDYAAFSEAIATVEIIDTATITFNSITP